MSSGAGGYNPEASLLSANPGVDLKVFAGGGLDATVGAGAYNNSVSMLHAPADPLPVVKFSGGGEGFDFVDDVLGLTEPITELQGITTLDAIKELPEDTLGSIYETLLANDIKFTEFLAKKGLTNIISETHQAVGNESNDVE